jgi:hypothetical protein
MTSEEGSNQIPALTKTGGTAKINSKQIKEYRVWVHPTKGGDDYYYRSDTYKEIIAIRKDSLNEGYVEKPLGVIQDKDGQYREVVLVK